MACTLLGLVTSIPGLSAPAPAKDFAVATESDPATEAAAQLLRRGAHAVDAAVAAALVAGVASPSSSGLGGGGFAMVWDAKAKKATCLDFREAAPSVLDAQAFERRPLSPADRGKLIGVPGEIAGLVELHRRFGSLPWAKVVAPASRVAAEGYVVSPHLAMVAGSMGARLSVDPLIDGLFRPGGNPILAGARLRNPHLAGSLRRLASEGAAPFYTGPVAAELVASARAANSGLSGDDLARYKPVERAPLQIRWEGHDVYTMAPPSGGGVLIAQTLGMLSRAELVRLGHNSAPYVHLLAEVFRGAIADRLVHLSDPDVQTVDVPRLLAPERLRARRARISLERTHAMPRFSIEEHGTHHISVADSMGNMVALTTTVNRAFGALVAGPKSGILLNDELDDFADQADVKAFGLTEGPNRARRNARPVSSMTPTIVVKDGVAILALGGSGGMTISPNVAQVLLGRLAFGLSPDQAVGAHRFGIPTEGALISLDPKATPALRADLERRGEIVILQRSPSHAVQVVARDGDHLVAASDPRKSGTARTATPTSPTGSAAARPGSVPAAGSTPAASSPRPVDSPAATPTPASSSPTAR